MSYLNNMFFDMLNLMVWIPWLQEVLTSFSENQTNFLKLAAFDG